MNNRQKQLLKEIENLNFGEVKIKVQNGKIVFTETIKKIKY